ncbi:MAG: thiamine ABC transporter substrate-binding protein [Actinobacteria bacterium]|nr:thiamine ABC transporter substrate-binding protein [Actinomycetota bacterium]
MAAAALGALALAATSCSLVGGDDDTGEGGSGESDTVVLLTHNDFFLPDEVVAAFEEESGYQLDVRPTDGVGNLVNLVSEQAGKPSGDVVFGVDNTFASRVLGADALTSYAGDLPPGVATYALPGDDEGDLVPVDNGNVCVNVDDVWFAKQEIEPPVTLDDLTDPAYEGLFVVPSAASSSPGLAFLLSTIAEYGDEWPSYWEDLLANDTEIVAGWSEAYQSEFTQGGGDGDRPIVVSYDSSPAFTVDGEGGTTTSALLDTCYQQVEYAAALDGAANPDGAQALLDFMVGPDVQAALPESMYVFPVADDTELPSDWATFAARPSESYEVDPAEIEANREDWLIEWTDIISR